MCTYHECRIRDMYIVKAQATGPSRRNPKKSYRSVSYNSATYQIWFRLPMPNPNNEP